MSPEGVFSYQMIAIANVRVVVVVVVVANVIIVVVKVIIVVVKVIIVNIITIVSSFSRKSHSSGHQRKKTTRQFITKYFLLEDRPET